MTRRLLLRLSEIPPETPGVTADLTAPPGGSPKSRKSPIPRAPGIGTGIIPVPSCR